MYTYTFQCVYIVVYINLKPSFFDFDPVCLTKPIITLLMHSVYISLL